MHEENDDIGMAEAEAHRFPAHQPSEQLNPNKYSGAYILGLHLTIRVTQFAVHGKSDDAVTKIYKMGRNFYVVPQIGEGAPKGYKWEKIGRKYGRNLFRSY